MGIFQRLNRERGITIVLVTHEPDIAEYARARDRVPRRPASADERQQPGAARRAASCRPTRSVGMSIS